MIHPLKTEPDPFQRIWDYRKKCEIRKNDRHFQLGDELLLKEWQPDAGKYTGRQIEVLITDIIMNRPEWGLMDGFVILSFIILTKREKNGMWGPKTLGV